MWRFVGRFIDGLLVGRLMGTCSKSLAEWQVDAQLLHQCVDGVMFFLALISLPMLRSKRGFFFMSTGDRVNGVRGSNICDNSVQRIRFERFEKKQGLKKNEVIFLKLLQLYGFLLGACQDSSEMKSEHK